MNILKFAAVVAAITSVAFTAPMTNVRDVVDSSVEYGALAESKELDVDMQKLNHPEESSITVYYNDAHNNPIILSHANSVQKIEPGEYFISEKNSGSVPDASSNRTSGIEQAIEVPESLLQNFELQIDGSFNNEPIKMYMGPDEKMICSSTFKRPDKIYSDDFQVYNGKFLKVKTEDNISLYINQKEANIKILPKVKMKFVGLGNDRHMISTEKNYTMDISTRTNLTEEDLLKITRGTELEGVESACVKAEEDYGVNSLFILSVAAQESGWGKSYLSHTRNNLFGICAFDTNVNAASSFSSKGQCIEYFARLIRNEYFSKGRTDPYSIGAIYASDQRWAKAVSTHMSEMLNVL